MEDPEFALPLDILSAEISSLSVDGDAENFTEVDSEEAHIVAEDDQNHRLDSTLSIRTPSDMPSYPYFYLTSQPRSSSPSARDQVLCNEDLLYIIFSSFHSHLDRWTFRRLSSPPLPAPKFALLPAALTCKAFFLPAMRVLWLESSILSLLRVIPVLVKKGKTFVLNGVITEEHMQRVDLYAGCIRRLHSFAFNVKVSSQVYVIISRLRHPTLLPALKQLKFLSIHNMPLENLNSLFLIKSATLADVQIGRIDSTTEVVVASFLQQVSFHTETLDLKGRLTHVTFNVLPKFQRLARLFLEIQPMTPQIDFLGMCSQIKTLEVLWLGIHPDFVYILTSTTAIEFSSLVSLILAAPVNPMIDILGIFRGIQLPRLESIRLNFRPTELSLDPRLAPCLVKCVQIAQSRASPLALMLEGSITARWNDLIPLRELKKVAGLHILFEALSVTNDDVQRFFGTGRWAMLKKLIISYSNTPLAPDALSWNALGLISSSCPKLVSLVISIRVDTDPVTIRSLQSEIQQNHRSESGVLSLSIHTTHHYDESQRSSYSVVGAAIVSRYITYCFPQLKEIKLRDPSNMDWCQGVERIVQNYQEIKNYT